MLPAKPEDNPREHVKAVTLRNGKEYEGQKMPEEEEPKQPPEQNTATEPESSAGRRNENLQVAKNPEGLQKSGKSNLEKVKSDPLKYVPPHRFIPFPQRLAKTKVDQQFDKFVEILKKLSITIPFTDAITQVPTYAKFLKEILSNKKRLEEVETVSLNEECSALFLNKLPPKLKDPGSFTIPCKIGETKFGRALCDLGASVSLMPKSVYERLDLGDLKVTRISLQLADKSVKFGRCNCPNR